MTAWLALVGSLLAVGQAEASRIVMVGSGLVERDQIHGFLETQLTARWPERGLVFRNLGWTGDTVFGDARAGFETAVEGYQRLLEEVRAAKPTMVIVAYGGVESFDGAAGLERFRQGLEHLLDDLDKIEPEPSVVLLTPPRQEDVGPPLPDPDAHNVDVAKYVEAIQALGPQRGPIVFDLFKDLISERPATEPSGRLTDDGIQLNERGARRFADQVCAAFGVSAPVWRVTIKDGADADGVQVEDLKRNPNGVAFKARSQRLLWPHGTPPTLAVEGLETGTYRLSIDGQAGPSATAAAWAEGVALPRHPDFGQFEKLRATIRAKNELVFHRWRPANSTYLFGFRKHEQGQNAREVPKFDPLIAAQEAEIAKLRAPIVYEFRLEKIETP
jgi:lysophospholipase L1-like esterase